MDGNEMRRNKNLRSKSQNLMAQGGRYTDDGISAHVIPIKHLNRRKKTSGRKEGEERKGQEKTEAEGNDDESKSALPVHHHVIGRDMRIFPRSY